MWAAMWIREKYIQGVDNEQQQEGNGELTRSNRRQHRTFDDFVKGKYAEFKDKIVRVIEQCYSDEVIEEYKDNKYEALAWMLFVDGCSVLELMKEADVEKPEALKIKIDQLILMLQDLLLLENQIPFQLLKLFCPEQDELFKSMNKFVKLHHMVNRDLTYQPGTNSPQPTHLLDYLRKKILGDDQTTIDFAKLNECKTKWPRHRNIQELKAAGIKVQRQRVADIRHIQLSCCPFFCRKLDLPEVIVDDSTATTYMNLIAYEMCPDFKNDFEISSYVAFAD
ncbi:hypothetical protein L6164_034191 [Bauhinia variegata]|uniref:Uncharacterized protein n=1 Tax=Bauhinia variegata TaxID=167791 RepID=A0ACB9KUX1_BAUVA|nr:hypothetical protein L6164_034191 [Bauhinia variegata]